MAYFKDYNNLGFNLYDNAYILRNKNLKEAIQSDMSSMSRQEINRRLSALNTVSKSREKEGFMTSLSRAFGMNPRPDSEEVGKAQAVLNSPEGSLPTGKLESEQTNQAPAPQLNNPTNPTSNTQLNQRNISNAAQNLQTNSPQSMPARNVPQTSAPLSNEASPLGSGGKSLGVPTAPVAKTLDKGFIDPDTGKQIGGQQFEPMEYKFGGGMGLPTKTQSSGAYAQQLSSTIQSMGQSLNQGSGYRPGMSNAPQQQQSLSDKNQEIAERNRKRSGMQPDQLLSKGMQLAQQSGINPMGQLGSAGGLNPGAAYLQNRGVGYMNQANISGFRNTRGFV